MQQVIGARPAANITWYNNTIPIRMDGGEHNERVSITGKTVSDFLLLLPAAIAGGFFSCNNADTHIRLSFNCNGKYIAKNSFLLDTQLWNIFR